MATPHQGTIDKLHTDYSSGWGFKHGAIGGLLAGVVFALFEMIAAAVMMGMPAFFMPLRMIGAIALGPVALDPSYSLVAAGFAGLVVHMALSIFYGVIFGASVAAGRNTALNTTGGLLAAASVYGLLLWLVNFYVIAPALFPWFLESSPLIQFIAHTFLYGTVLGIYLDRASAPHRLTTSTRL